MDRHLMLKSQSGPKFTPTQVWYQGISARSSALGQEMRATVDGLFSFLGTRADMEQIAAAIEKIHRQAEDLLQA
jgi:hypothetical protein